MSLCFILKPLWVITPTWDMRVNCSVCQDDKVIKILSPMWVCGVCILRSHKIDLYKKKEHKAPWIRLYKKKSS